jgi:hypothetical protein
MKSIEIFINFPIMDINRNALWKNPERVSVVGMKQPSGISLGSQKKKTMPRLLVPIEKDLKL